MALTEENQRRSVTNFYLYVYPPIPDGNIDIFDRRQIAGFYRLLGFATHEIRQYLTVTTRTKLFTVAARVKNYVTTSRVKEYIVPTREKKYEVLSRVKTHTVVAGIRRHTIKV